MFVELEALKSSLRQYERRNLLRWFALSLFGFAEPENQRITLLRDFLRQIHVESEAGTTRFVTSSEFFDFVRTQTRFPGLDPEQLFNAEYLNGPQKSATLVFKSFLDNSVHIKELIGSGFPALNLLGGEKFPELDCLRKKAVVVDTACINPVPIEKILDEFKKAISGPKEEYKSVLEGSTREPDDERACYRIVQYTTVPSAGLVVADFENSFDTVGKESKFGLSNIALRSRSVIAAGGGFFLKESSAGEGGLTISPLTETPELAYRRRV